MLHAKLFSYVGRQTDGMARWPAGHISVRLLAMTLLLLPGFASAQTSQAEPWEVAGKERIALWDQVLVNQKSELNSGGETLTPRRREILQKTLIRDGEASPAALFPWELAQAVPTILFSEDADYRLRQMSGNRAFIAMMELGGFRSAEDLWDRVHSAFAPLIELSQSSVAETDRAVDSNLQVADLRSHLLPDNRDDWFHEDTVVAFCRARHGALEDLRGEFGQLFNEFLYTEIAPRLSLSGLGDQDSADLALEFDRGCMR